ncbi:hypothetical protein Igag_1676 [Ignisphaera aggregans DSM 17230]|uniref:Uncharacterized protein n=1 Tax=Ignisphaera aggregans (strain DSM 17230 / JCM 13409 / AQ1.S1) TaxID=583356 RepID=E0SRU2_IGNAA|nr:hypothetical protein Igag_1676 [Ignisphaera aggregans DSM 17230]
MDHHINPAVNQILDIVYSSVERSYILLVSGFRDMAVDEFRAGLLTGLLLTKIYCNEEIIDGAECADIVLYISSILDNNDIEKAIEDLYIGIEHRESNIEEIAIAI